MFDMFLALSAFIIYILALCYLLMLRVERDAKDSKKSIDHPHIISDPIVYALNYNKTHDDPFDEYLHPEDIAKAKSNGIDFEQNEYDFSNDDNYQSLERSILGLSDLNHKSAKDTQKSIKSYGTESI